MNTNGATYDDEVVEVEVVAEVEVDLGSKQAFRPLCDPFLVYIQSH